MSLPKRYNPRTAEPRLRRFWNESGIYHFDPDAQKPIYAIDTPPATVSGHLHMGHVYSYSHPDFIARYRRMAGYNVFYPMGYDDNGLPTERLVERIRGITAAETGRQAFIAECLRLSEELEQEYRALWERLGLSTDPRYTYRTIDDRARRTAQTSFLQLVREDRAYRSQAPAIWCPTCRTAIAQAEVDDLARTSRFVTIPFGLPDGESLPIATTRPELLPACVAVFVHPADPRYRHLAGQQVTVPLTGRQVPLLADPAADPEKGSGAVMCCTFGDTVDVAWWRTHDLPLHIILGQDGHLTSAAGAYAGLSVEAAREQIIADLEKEELLLAVQPVEQSVRVHERCDTPVEYLVTPQWYVRVLDCKERLLAAGAEIQWHPPHMQTQYRTWVENLGWDWSISRQRVYGVPFPVWYCDDCGKVLLADAGQLPVDPVADQPPAVCSCGSRSATPETDVMDTWATSSLTPQIAGRWLDDPVLFAKLFPMSLRPQAHEIIRTWAFYTIVQSLYHLDTLPWQDILISGWGLAPQGSGKISKSRGGGPIAPMAALETYSADAARYWAASTSPGKDSVISEEKMGAGQKLVTKLWNVARFSARFLADYDPAAHAPAHPALTPADRWILSRTQDLVRRVTDAFQNYDYAIAKSETEVFFWTELADNYVEMAKRRLYRGEGALYEGARTTLYQVLLAVLKLFAPILPYVTEEIYRDLFAPGDARASIHTTSWPVVDPALLDPQAERVGIVLLAITEAVRRYKSERQLALGTELARLCVATPDAALADGLQTAREDLKSTTRAQTVQIGEALADGVEIVHAGDEITVGVVR